EELCASRGDYAALVDALERRAQAAREGARSLDALRRAVTAADTYLDDPARVAKLRAQVVRLDPSDEASASALEAFYRERKEVTALISFLHTQIEASRDSARTVELLQRVAEVSEDDARDVEGAILHYTKILEIEPRHVESLEALSRIYESTERWTELIEITRRQIKGMADRSSKALLYFRCGSVMEAKFGREEDAIRYYQAAITVSTACMPAVHGLRDLYRRRQEWARVVETLELELKLWQDDKERAGVLAQIGQVYAERIGDGRSARQYFHEALAVDPECVPANWALFEDYFAAGNWEQARPLASSLTQRAMHDGDPATRSEFYRKRAMVSLHTGDPRDAAESFVVALEIRPTNLDALEALGRVARNHPTVYDFESTYRELERIYRRRDDAAPLLARVWMGLATLAERAGDLDHAADLSSAATSLAPTDLIVLMAVVDFHCDMRRWAAAVDAILAFLPQANPADVTAARLRLAELHADGQRDAARAIAVLGDVVRDEPTCHEAHYLLAQQHYLHGRLAEARAAMDAALELAESLPAATADAALARYHYYRGRILGAQGDGAAAEAQYRLACDHDRGYAPPALLLARRAAEVGDHRQAEALLIEAARAAIEQRGVVGAVPMQRGLARILLANGDRVAAIEAYRGILAVTPDNATDRVALAEIYAVDDLPRAIAELRKVIDRDLRHAPAYRLLAWYYEQQGELERAARVLAVLELMGFAEDSDLETAQRLRAARVAPPIVSSLGSEQRHHLLATRATRDVLGEVWSVFAPAISALFPPFALGEDLVPMEAYGDASLCEDYAEVARIFETSAEVFLGDRVPGMTMVVTHPRRAIVIDRALAQESRAARRFLFGWSLDAIRGSYAVLLSLGASQCSELSAILRELFASEGDRSGVAAELVRVGGASGTKVLDKYAGRVRELDVEGWMDGMLAGAKRSGLLACDEFEAAIWMIARLSGERLAGHDDTAALGAVLGGADLVRYYLSDDYQRLRQSLTAAKAES
ncbi:MAG TPA: tetratricopeptide repeat protein, partial [Kofleriaceae bacterium]|nr:tetratricopeptide repeat protein [Kofleriaceae bacterium]